MLRSEEEIQELFSRMSERKWVFTLRNGGGEWLEGVEDVLRWILCLTDIPPIESEWAKGDNG